MARMNASVMFENVHDNCEHDFEESGQTVFHNIASQIFERIIQVISQQSSNRFKMNCVFCQYPLFEAGKERIVATCGHCFHKDCFENAVKAK